MVNLSERIEQALNRLLSGTRTLVTSQEILEKVSKLVKEIEVRVEEIVLYHPKRELLMEVIHHLNNNECYISFVKDGEELINVTLEDVKKKECYVVFSTREKHVFTRYYELNDYFRIEKVEPAQQKNFAKIVGLNARFVEDSQNSMDVVLSVLINKYNKAMEKPSALRERWDFVCHYWRVVELMKDFIEKEKRYPKRFLKFEIIKETQSQALHDANMDQEIKARVYSETEDFLTVREGMWLEYRKKDERSLFKVIDVIDADEGVVLVKKIKGNLNLDEKGEFIVLPNEFVVKQIEMAIAALLLAPYDSQEYLISLLGHPREYIDKEDYSSKEVKFKFSKFNEPSEENKAQIKALKKALFSKNIAVIYGPPGSGKTQIIAELIYHYTIRQKKKVLFVAPTHIAVDNVLERLERDYGKDILSQIAPIRVGPEERISEDYKKYLLPYVIDTMRDKLTENIENLLGSYNLGNPLKKLIKEYLEKVLRSKEEFSKIGRYIVKSTRLICCTLIGAVSLRELRDVEPIFDVLILDEASKASMIEFLVPAIKAKKWIIIGDPNQLPPYIDDYEIKQILKIVAEKRKCKIDERDLDDIIGYWRQKWEGHISDDKQAEEEYDKKLDEILSKYKVKDELKRVLKSLAYSFFISPIVYLNRGVREYAVCLDYQYRMHPDIAEIPNKFIYNGSYKSPDDPDYVEKKTLKLKLYNKEVKPVVFIDTGSRARETREGTSYYNEYEIKIIINVLKQLLSQLEKIEKKENKGEPWTIGVITFYVRQARKIRDELRRRKNEIGLNEKGSWTFQTRSGAVEVKVSIVDRFQGQEKDIIILSFVRSNRRGKIGFLRNKNRINVAITRARRLLIMVGNSQTLRKNDLLSGIIEYVRKNGLFIFPMEKGEA